MTEKKKLDLTTPHRAGLITGAVGATALWIATGVMLVSLGAWPIVVWAWVIVLILNALVKGAVQWLEGPKVFRSKTVERPVINITVEAVPDAKSTADRVAEAMKRGLAVRGLN